MSNNSGDSEALARQIEQSMRRGDPVVPQAPAKRIVGFSEEVEWNARAYLLAHELCSPADLGEAPLPAKLLLKYMTHSTKRQPARRPPA